MAIKYRICTAMCALTLTSALAAASSEEASHRFAPLTEDMMTDAQKAVPIVQGQLKAGKYNPNGFDAILLRNPGLEDAVLALAGEVYIGTTDDKPTLPKGLAEIGILLLSTAWDFPEMFESHGPGALKAGISQATLDAIAKGERPIDMKADETAVYNFCHELIIEHAVSDNTFKRLRDHLSERDVVDLIGTLSVYTTSLMYLKAANISSH